MHESMNLVKCCAESSKLMNRQDVSHVDRNAANVLLEGGTHLRVSVNTWSNIDYRVAIKSDFFNRPNNI